ncbi:serine hydrolase domain-containing protein [Deinococcus humi]|uniref:CubicO group peptidase (Beta-lactamase class C family) n=1 Tax=Deinococcus humi TaxID=662880 RepID=A0A7W8JYN7_9DEIO|nr:serine hydrolase domain-containing protein [Deinococcus humi]MBB5364181.1 CubicO group peptidase (beta-lactamase class C family) [Deinococcus humi]GGO38624.1 serine hydrolase [Deinococcus humi]
MFRRDPVKLALARVSAVIGIDTGALLGLTRGVFRRGGVLAALRGEQQVILSLGGVDTRGAFELASVTKPFTGALAGTLVEAGRLDWEIPLARLGGPFARLPPHLTPLALSTHTAGLPMHPARAAVTVFTRFHDPYGNMGATDAIASARRWSLLAGAPPRSAGGFAYSNLGAGVLALALAHAAGEEVSAAGYGRALHGWVTGPLGLGVSLTPAGAVVRPAGPLGGGSMTGFGPLVGAGGLFGTAADLLGFGASRLGAPPAPLLRPAGLPRHIRGVTPGWMVSSPDGEVRWHDGLARGTRTGLGLNLRTGTVVALLARGTDSPLGPRGVLPTLLLALLGAGREQWR